MTLELSTAEFARLQRLSASELRAMLDLPGACEPVMAAVRPGPRGRIVVLVSCADEPGTITPDDTVDRN
ncbi:MAG TPA: hypothetical protein VFQ62_20405 [Methylomirabilota bacterium]|nr:hypothetical protein [Methylomirabilota bacterium]